MRVAELVFAAPLVRKVVGIEPLNPWFGELSGRLEYLYLQRYETALRDLCHAVGGVWWVYGTSSQYPLTEAQLCYRVATVHYYVTHRCRIPPEVPGERQADDAIVWPEDAVAFKFNADLCFEVLRRRQLLQRTQVLVDLDLG